MIKKLFLLTVLVSLSFQLSAKVLSTGVSEGMKFEVVQVIDGLNIPWGFDFINANKMILTEKNGKLSFLDLKTGQRTPIKGLPNIYQTGQGGLLDVRIHPRFTDNPWYYITYVEKEKGQGITSLARFKIKNGQVADFDKLLATQSRSKTSRHFGSRIAFDQQGYLYFSVGDRGVRKNGQDLSTHAGSIMRLKLDGNVPSDNPFINKENARKEIWTYGHRNPQGLVYDKENQRLWSIEHGPRGGDEINLIEKANNYGWPVISYGKEYWGPVDVGGTHKEGMEQPVYQYTPSIAPCGLEIYSGKLFPQWKGNLFSGALALTHLNRIVLDGTKFKKEDRLLKDLNLRVRNVREAPDGRIYISTDLGQIIRIQPKSEQSKKGAKK